ncbi:MAG: putative DNA binding domain-containing protein, partial [Candidatus Marinimicrobia bacterium]|nr:putative DNA binding domain-containing protein [Candidatus Neomarinimicrobiota bacterium]
MKYKDLLDLVKTREGYTIEFKESISSSLGKEICAFANGQGGKIILGVKDDGSIKGINLTNKNISRVQNIARNIDPSFEVVIEQIENLGIIYVPEGKEKPYTVSGHFYLRQGANSQQLDRDEIKTFFQKENQISFERKTKNFTDKDFSNTVLKNFKRNANISKNLSKNHTLKNLNLLTNDKLNNAGILFFTQHIKKYFQMASIMCFLYSDIEQTEIIDSKEFAEDFISNLENANNYLISKLNTAIIIKDELRHKEKLELPKEALREAVINAMIHRDYFVNSNVQINISPDKVEIINPGKLLFPKSDFGKISVRRNPILVDLVHRLGLVEKAGSGIKRIKGLTKKYKTKVKFKTGEFFTTIFFRETDLKKIERKSNTNRTQIRRKSDANPTQIRRKWILTFLENENKITNKIIRERFILHKDTVSKGLRDMVAQNEIIQKGDGNNVWFELDPTQIR